MLDLNKIHIIQVQQTTRMNFIDVCFFRSNMDYLSTRVSCNAH